MTTLLIDADTIAFKAALGAEHNHEWEDNVISRGADLNLAIETFENEVTKLCETYGATDHRIALTGPINFRKTVLPTYKAKRGPKPICLGELREHIVANCGGVIKTGIEADDVVGIWATHPTLIKGDKIVYSIDKDLRTIPCRYTNGKGPVMQLTVSSANYCFLKQVLTGDSTDGYAGLPGCGPKGASKLLMDFVDEGGGFNTKLAWLAIVDAYIARGLTADDALVQARVARILRYQDFNFKTKEPILWSPPVCSPS